MPLSEWLTWRPGNIPIHLDFKTRVVFCRDLNKSHFPRVLSLNQFRHALNCAFLEHLKPRVSIKLKVTEPIRGEGHKWKKKEEQSDKRSTARPPRRQDRGENAESTQHQMCHDDTGWSVSLTLLSFTVLLMCINLEGSCM